MVNPSSAYLDNIEYWRLLDDGFRNMRECLGDLQNIMWKWICNLSGMLTVLHSKRGIGDTFFTALASIAASIRKIAQCRLPEIRDDGIELGEWLQDMAHLDLQCVVPRAAEPTNLVDLFRTTTE